MEVTGYGTVTGLKGANSRHDFYPVIPGISEPSYTEEELRNIDPPPFEYDGKTYTYYEATQRQRYMERSMRKTKRELLAADSTGDKDRFTEKSVLLRRQKEEYGKFSKAAGLLTQNERTQVYGYDWSKSAKTVWAERKANASVANERFTVKDYENISLTVVSESLYSNPKWRANFNKLASNTAVNNSIRNISEQILKHRSGTFYEDMYFINAKTGKIEGYNTKSKSKCKVGSNASIEKALNKSNVDLIGIHNHPFSSVPSLSDLNVIASRSAQKFGVIICHDGTIFTYSKPKAKISEQVYEAALTKHKKYSRMTMEDKGFNELGNIYGFEYERIELYE